MPRTKKEQGVGAPVQTETPDVETLMHSLAKVSAENETLKNSLNRAVAELKQLNRQDLYVKLDWLWKVITLDCNSDIFGEEFVTAKVEEFKFLMTPPAEEQKE